MQEQPARLVTDDIRTPPPPVPICEMDEAAFRSFVNMMLWLVIDEAEPLGEFGSASTEFADGQQVMWGPWPRADCSALLLRWFDAGLLSVFGLGIDNEYPGVEARRLLEDYESWTTARPDPFVGRLRLESQLPTKRGLS